MRRALKEAGLRVDVDLQDEIACEPKVGVSQGGRLLVGRTTKALHRTDGIVVSGLSACLLMVLLRGYLTTRSLLLMLVVHREQLVRLACID